MLLNWETKSKETGNISNSSSHYSMHEEMFKIFILTEAVISGKLFLDVKDVLMWFKT